MKKWPYIITTLFLCSLSCLLIVGLSFGDHISNLSNYTLTFVVPFPPSNVQMTIIAPERQGGFYEQSFYEGYYSFYFNDLSDITELTFKVYQNKYNKTPFEFSIEKPSHFGKPIYTLDLTKQQIYEGLYPYRTLILVAPKVGIFLALETFLLWAAGFKQKRNWLILLGSTLISQTLFSLALIDPIQVNLAMPLFGLGIPAIIDMILFFSVISDEGNNRSTRLFVVSNLLRAFIMALMIL